MICSNCNTEVHGSPKFCKKCGAALADQQVPPVATKVCPQCGTENPTNAKFCKRDGYAFEAKPSQPPPPPQAPPPATPSATKATSSKTPILLGIIVLLLLGAGGGGYFYWSKKKAEAPAVLSGFDTATPTPQGIPQPSAPPPSAPPVSPQIPDSVGLGKAINEQLRAAGLTTVIANVDDRRHVVLGGTVSSRAAKEKAVSIARAQDGVADVDTTALEIFTPKEKTATATPSPRLPAAPKPLPPVQAKHDPAKLEGDVGRALRSNGINGVTAQVSDDFVLTLKGSVTSDTEKERAFNVARRFEGIKSVKDKIFVVTP